MSVIKILLVAVLAVIGGVYSSRLVRTYNSTNHTMLPSYPHLALNYTNDASRGNISFSDSAVGPSLDDNENIMDSRTKHSKAATTNSEIDTYSNGNMSLWQHMQKGGSRMKRNLWNLFRMLGKMTDCNRWELMDYGNYCGIGGSGYPIDDVDRCCQEHDECYGHYINVIGCWRFNVYVMSYDYLCNTDVTPPICYCDWETNDCRRGICECDKKFSQCLQRADCP